MQAATFILLQLLAIWLTSVKVDRRQRQPKMKCSYILSDYKLQQVARCTLQVARCQLPVASGMTNWATQSVLRLPCARPKSSSLILFPAPLPSTPPRAPIDFLCRVFTALATPAQDAGAFNYTGRIMCQQAAATAIATVPAPTPAAAPSNCQHWLTRPPQKAQR